MSEPPALLLAVHGCLTKAGLDSFMNSEEIVLVDTSEHCALEGTITIPKESRILFLVLLERRCPEQFCETLSDFLNRVNSRLPTGFFLLESRRGEVRFRKAIDTAEVTPAFIVHFVKSGFMAVAHFYPAIQRIMAGKSVEAALATV
jgi:hypothetical protein